PAKEVEAAITDGYEFAVEVSSYGNTADLYIEQRGEHRIHLSRVGAPPAYTANDKVTVTIEGIPTQCNGSLSGFSYGVQGPK
ncbi:hypothetical protein, partial [Klebsiella pneumoniae]|uniref:hypothetical protein n=1 Tax=Klebsiella pneumoniae TaxID=573 RepID=UPI0025A0F625